MSSFSTPAVVSAIACPLGCSGEGEVSSEAFATMATVSPCPTCLGKGGTPWQVRLSEVAMYLRPATVARHVDGLVVFAGAAL